jgi:hypothetical protein
MGAHGSTIGGMSRIAWRKSTFLGVPFLLRCCLRKELSHTIAFHTGSTRIRFPRPKSHWRDLLVATLRGSTISILTSKFCRPRPPKYNLVVLSSLKWKDFSLTRRADFFIRQKREETARWCRGEGKVEWSRWWFGVGNEHFLCVVDRVYDDWRLDRSISRN